MHAWYTDKSSLAAHLQNFIGGQIQIITRYGEIFIGNISRIEIDVSSQRKTLKVVCVGFFSFKNRSWKSSPDELIFRDLTDGFYKIAISEYIIEINYTRYYYQEHKKRVKLKTDADETVRFFMKGDEQTVSISEDGTIKGPKNPLFQD